VATLNSQNDVTVNLSGGKTEKINSNYIIFATGLVDNKNIAKYGETEVMESLFQTDSLPKNVILVGANYISFELASVLTEFGSEVIIIEENSEITLPIDAEIQAILLDAFDLQDIEIKTDLKLKEYKKNNEKSVLKIDVNGKEEVLEANLIIDLRDETKQKPLLGSKEFGEIKILKDGFTNYDNIFVAGDIKNELNLSSLATLDGMVVIDIIYDKNNICHSPLTPIVIRTSPDAGKIGLTEKEALDEGYQIKVERYPFAMNPMTRITESPEGMVKLISDKRSKKLLGAHVIGENASELIHQLSLMIRVNINARDLISDAPFHPSLSEMLRDALKRLFS